MRASTKAVILFTAFSLGPMNGRMNGQMKDQLNGAAGQKKAETTAQTFATQRSIVMFGQPISEKRTPMPVVELSPQQRKWVIEAFLEQVDSMRSEAGVKGVLQWNETLERGAQAYADTMTKASDEQWERWGHTLGGPMAVHTGKYSRGLVLAECAARDWHNTDPKEFSESEWREIGAKAAFWMKFSKNSTGHYGALLTNAKLNEIGMGVSMHTQTIGTGKHAFTQWVSNLVFWIGHP